ncbi:hypothetical protein [Aestuariibaculum lutulentum]|uniref:Uncharacterized protein n=1 Tax=Aestuariibaculum lutulentum TaxID=2920935 RepID=A0ABS9RH88_9FLAO|nr:hypothetical protein [Aestuariibaculum lutulentum]MCH4552305.1 hypothetical protein [Aestuariibaculum lutulentum]
MNNHRNIKVSDALRKGKRVLIRPIYMLFLVFFFLVPGILMYVFRENKNSLVLILGSIFSFVLGIILPFLWWGINVVKYKIWAANNVKDIHRFYEEAQVKNLIDERLFFKRIEIKTSRQEKDLLRFYERLGSERILVRDIDNSIKKNTVFKSSFQWNILIYLILMLGALYMYQTSHINYNGLLIFEAIFAFLICLDIYKTLKYKYVLKIDDKFISYKDGKVVIDWKDVIGYSAIPRINNIPSKLIISTISGNQELTFESFGKIKMDEIIDVLNENKHRFEINHSLVR